MSIRGPKSSSAFTLLELILVMLIIAIAAAVVVPSLANFALGRTTENAVQQVLNLSQYARTQAVNQGRVYHMNFDGQSNQVWITTYSAGVDQAVPNDFGNRYTLPDGMKMAVQIMPRPNTTWVMTQNIQPTDVQAQPMFGQPVWPLMNVVQQLPRAGGNYIEIDPSGRTDPALIRLTDKSGKEIDLGLATSTEVLHRLTPAEMK